MRILCGPFLSVSFCIRPLRRSSFGSWIAASAVQEEHARSFWFLEQIKVGVIKTRCVAIKKQLNGKSN
jgi:hypothetical protein